MNHGGNVWQGGAPSDWLDYSANIRPEGPPEWVRRALAEGVEAARYYPDPEMRRARAALAEYLNLPEVLVRPTAGGISAIDLAARLPTSGALLCAPCFGEYAMLCARHGLPVRKVSLLQGDHGIGDPAEAVRDALFEGCIVWLCNPLNPVGAAFTRNQVRCLLGEVEAAKGWLVVDEAFIEYCPEHSVADLVERCGRLLVTGSMTKILGIPGVRLGYLCAQPALLENLAQNQLTWELNCFAEAVACALPEHRADILSGGRANAARREELRAGLEALGVRVYPSEAAFLLADFGRPVDGIVQNLKRRRILVRGCMDFDGLDDGCHLRLAVKDPASNERLIQALREAMTCAENL